MNKELIQLIHIIRYRLEKSTKLAPTEYFEFKAGNDSRSPSEILSHLLDVINYGLNILGIPKPSYLENSVLEKIKMGFMTMKSYLSKNGIDEDSAKKLINGPLSDTLTHIGQLAFLRRLQGNSMEWENYTHAET